jgi:nucleotide-binding universal stress UspA family protein
MEDRKPVQSESGSSWVDRVVVAADASPASGEGLKQAAQLASRVGSKVTVVFVRHLPATALMAPGFGDPALLQVLDEQEAEVRREASRILGDSGVVSDFVVRDGSPGEEILKVADETGADLVVVGSNRHSSLHNRLLGSTAAHIAAHSQAPVLIMRSRPVRDAEPTTLEVLP